MTGESEGLYSHLFGDLVDLADSSGNHKDRFNVECD